MRKRRNNKKNKNLTPIVDEQTTEEVDAFDDDYLSDIERQLAEEREEKYEKLDQMTDEERAAYHAEQSRRMREWCKRWGVKVETVHPVDGKKED